MFSIIGSFYSNYKIYIIALAISGLLASAFAFGYRFSSNACKAEKLEDMQVAIIERQKYELLLQMQSKGFEDFKQNNEIQQRDLQKRLKNAIKTDDAYSRDIPIGGLQLLAEAVAAVNTR